MKILIIEDEPVIAGELKDLITKNHQGAEFLGVLDSIENSVKFLSDAKNEPDVIFMDIQLADGSSFEIFSLITINCPVIFCTAYDQYMLEAFKSNGIEYILKPVTDDDIQKAFNKLEKLRLSFNSESNILAIIKNAFSKPKDYLNSILVHHLGGYIPICVDNIAFFHLTNEIVYAHCYGNKKYSIYKSMEEIESTLNPNHFYRINRQILLNRSCIKEIQPYVNRKVIIKTDLQPTEELVVSRLKVTPFFKWIEQP
jgi:two-component system, LytTR family, response regulator LytT